MARTERWKLWDPGSCDCPCEEVGARYCRWPCCVYGMRFSIEPLAAEVDEYGTPTGNNGLFICVGMVVTVHHYQGGSDQSISHSHFEKVNVRVATDPKTYHYWGGAVDMYTFGIPVKTEDLLCLHPYGVNVDVELVYVNVTTSGLPPVGQPARLSLSGPVLNAYWDTTPHVMPCSFAEEVQGTWTNIGNACDPDFAVTCTVDYLEYCAIRYSFINADPSAVCHKCVEIANSEIVHKTANCVGNTLPAKYEDTGAICFVKLPCDVAWTEGTQIGDYTVEDGCDDVDCPPCLCIPENCECGCTGFDLSLGNPHYLDLPKVQGLGISLDGLQFEVCTGGFAGSSGSPACAVFGHNETTYGLQSLSEIPFEIIWDNTRLSWKAFFRGTSGGAAASFEVFGPDHPGITSCNWHTVKLWIDGSGDWVLSVDVGAGFVDGPAKTPSATKYPVQEYYWGAHNRDQLGAVNGIRIPPGSLKTA